MTQYGNCEHCGIHGPLIYFKSIDKWLCWQCAHIQEETENFRALHEDDEEEKTA